MADVLGVVELVTVLVARLAVVVGLDDAVMLGVVVAVAVRAAVGLAV